MKKGMIMVTMVLALILAFHLPVFAQQDITPDLRTVPDGKGWKGSIDLTKLVEKDGAAAIESATREDKQNGATQPSLVVNELSDRTGGSVGLWWNGYAVIACAIAMLIWPLIYWRRSANAA